MQKHFVRINSENGVLFVKLEEFDKKGKEKKEN